MAVAADHKKDRELLGWVESQYNLQKNPKFMPQVTLECYKQGELLETSTLNQKPVHLLGKLRSNDVMMEHPSISRTHAAIVFVRDKGVLLVDLGSRAGTIVAELPAKELEARNLKNNDIIKFGASTREYKVIIDFTEADKNIETEKRELREEIKIMKMLEDPNMDPEELRRKMGYSTNDTIFVANIDLEAKFEEVKSFFERYGDIKEIRMPQDKNFAFITFEKSSSAVEAVRDDGTKLKSRNLTIKFADPKKPSNDRRSRDNGDKHRRHGDHIRKERDRHEPHSRRKRSRSPRDRHRLRHHKREESNSRSHSKDKKHSDRRHKHRRHRRSESRRSSSNRRRHSSPRRKHSRSDRHSSRKHARRHHKRRPSESDPSMSRSPSVDRVISGRNKRDLPSASSSSSPAPSPRDKRPSRSSSIKRRSRIRR